MNDDHDLPANEVERLLGAAMPPGGDERLRQALLLQTTRMLQRRRRWKHTGVFAALVFFYAAGMATMYLFAPNRVPAEVPPVDRSSAVQLAEVLPAPASAEDIAPPLEQDPNVPAVVFERMASATPKSRAHFYLRAGDRYLEVDGDLQSALRCYRHFLEASPATDLSVSANDSWLLMSLKQSRQK